MNKVKYFFIIFLITFISVNPCLSQEGQSSLLEKVSSLEKQVLHKTYTTDSLLSRLVRLEKATIGKEQEGSLFFRIDRINNYLTAKNSNPNTSIPVIAEDIPKKSDNPALGEVQAFSADKNPKEISSNVTPTNDQNTLPALNTGSDKPKDPNATVQSSNPAANIEKSASASDEKGKKEKKPKKDKHKEPEFDQNASNYYDLLMYTTQNQVIHWKKMPIKIYLGEGKNFTYFPEYKDAVIKGFDSWKNKSNGVISYVLVDNPKIADMEVVWQENFTEATKAGDATSTYGINPTQSMAGNIIGQSAQFIPSTWGYYGASILGALVGGIGNGEKLKDVKLRIGTLPTIHMAKEHAVNYVQSVAAHEFGHALGIACHSNNPNDLMYPEIDENATSLKEPSQRDINTLLELYKHEPDISN